MNKNAIQRFAIWARTELISQVSQRAYQYDITKDGSGDYNAEAVAGRLLSKEEKRQRQQFIDQIQHCGYDQAVEEVAYTWFNRFIALRFMEVNNYLPTHIRVFSDASGAFKPEILAQALHLDLPELDMTKVANLIEKNQIDDLYRYLLIAQCNDLNSCLPEMFEPMGSYTELLLPNNILRPDGIIGRMLSDISESDWTDQVQILGWLYQYYNSEKKDEVFAGLKNNKKVTKENIAPATQLFTPDWIVRYMVENSLGRLWLDGHPDSALRAEMPYYLEEAEQEESVRKQLDQIKEERKRLSPEQIRVIDPCMGSGHILVYAFDLLMKIYLSCGYSERDAVINIITKNIWGLELDKRAYQLAYFAVMMTAQKYDKRFLVRIRDRKPDQKETDGMPDGYLYTLAHFQGFPVTDGADLEKPLREFVLQFKDADTYGSLISVKAEEGLDQASDRYEGSLFMNRDQLEYLMRLYNILSQKYDVVCTNPPYMGAGNMDAKLSDYVKKNFPDSKADLFACFIERCGMFTKPTFYQAMITQHAWMFLSSFEKLRTKLLAVDTVNMAHLGARTFEEIGGEVVQTTSFVIRRSSIPDYAGLYCRLIEPTTQKGKEDMFLSGDNRYTAKQSNFSKIPGSPIAYWVSENLISKFEKCPKLNDVGITRLGMTTGENARFVRLWYEVNINNCEFHANSQDYLDKTSSYYVPYNKGGNYRKWFGNNDYVLYWKERGYDIKHFADDNGRIRSTVPNTEYYFLPCVSWSKVSSGKIAFRYKNNSIFDVAGACYFAKKYSLSYMLGFLNSKVVEAILSALSPTMNYEGGQIASLPVEYNECFYEEIIKLVDENINISKQDWDSFETSWDFKAHPLAAYRRGLWDGTAIAATISRYYGEVKKVSCPLELCWLLWQAECGQRFEQLKKNEEELNRIFIDIYGLQDELTPEVDDKDVTVRKADLQRDIRSFISYAVGCMFGRYSLDREGLILAGQDFGSVYAKNPQGYSFGDVVTLSGNYIHQRDGDAYSWQECSFFPDEDNCIPITDDEYFTDDIVGRFVEFVKVVYGEKSLEDNLRFIAKALGNKGGTSREVIRNYFLNDFYADHLKIYQKRPIYWLFDSGKKNGFKALVYMQRYKSDLLAHVRTDYVHEQQERYRTQLSHISDAMTNASAQERVKLSKQQSKLTDQALELQRYEEKIHHLADMNIKIDLDDGVKHNYALFEDVLAKIK